MRNIDLISPAVIKWFEDNKINETDKSVWEVKEMLENFVANNQDVINESLRAEGIIDENNMLNEGFFDDLAKERKKKDKESGVIDVGDLSGGDDDEPKPTRKTRIVPGGKDDMEAAVDKAMADVEDYDPDEDEGYDPDRDDDEVEDEYVDPDADMYTKERIKEDDDVPAGKKRLKKVTNTYGTVDNIYRWVDSCLRINKKMGWEDNKITPLSYIDTSNITSMVAVFAFAHLPNANLSTWDTSKVIDMEGMFYKADFDNDSIKDWDVSECGNFKNMFVGSTMSDRDVLRNWRPGKMITDDSNAERGSSRVTRKDVYARLPINQIRATLDADFVDDDEEVEARFADPKAWGIGIEKSKAMKENRNMRSNKYGSLHIMRRDEFVNEGLSDFVKRTGEKISGAYHSVKDKVSAFIDEVVDKFKSIFQVVSGYRMVEYIKGGNVKGVSAYSFNETIPELNDNGYMEIVKKDSVEYENYKTFLEMVNGEGQISEARVGFSAHSGGINILDINSEELKEKIITKLDDREMSAPLMIWGAPGIGKSSIPNAIIRALNSTTKLDKDKMSVLVADCGMMTQDGMSLPIPDTKTVVDMIKGNKYLIEKANKLGLTKEELADNIILRASDAPKLWLPMYKYTATDMDELLNDIANSSQYMKVDENGKPAGFGKYGGGGILMFDEFFRANPNVFRILMQVVTTREYQGFRLGDKWAIICCTNRPNDDKEVWNKYKDNASGALRSRFDHYNFVPDFGEWKKWADKSGLFDEITYQFLTSETDSATGEYTNWHNIDTDASVGKRDVDDTLNGISEVASPTPRTWTYAMINIKDYCKKNKVFGGVSQMDERAIILATAGCIGPDMARKYAEFVDTHRSYGVNPREILTNSKYTIKKQHVEYVCDTLLSYIKSQYSAKKKPTPDELINMITFFKNSGYTKLESNNISQLCKDIIVYLGISNADLSGKGMYHVFIDLLSRYYDVEL